MSSTSTSDAKLALPAFLKVLTNANMTMQKAMTVAGKMSVSIHPRLRV